MSGGNALRAVKVVAIEPHGLCGGVRAAIETALKQSNVWCLHSLVHNEIVVEELRSLGYRFVDRIEEVPVGEKVVFSAHGVSPRVREVARERGLKVIDTTCPFVARMHKRARDFAVRGLPVVVLGDPDHAEVKGVLGECPGATVWKDGPVDRVKCGRGRIGVVSQTTLNADDVARRIAELRARQEVEADVEVCPATKLRQDAVRRFRGDAVLVLGSMESSNTRRLAEVAAEKGARVFRAGSMAELEQLDFSGVGTLGVTSGASTPERFFDEAMRFVRRVPNHLAIIMDGNGRWATQRDKRRGEGHLAGAKTLSRVLTWCGERGIRYLTVYAFSTENWKRPKPEVDGLMRLFAKMLRSKALDFMRNEVRFRMIGRRGDLSKPLRSAIERLEKKTRHFEREFIVAISYGGRAEIVDAANAALKRGEPLTEETFRAGLYAPDVPDPDLVIRTSGEYRLSNFLLWESAYSEYYFTDVLWPDFSEQELDKALACYAARNRRKGGLA